MSTRRHRPRSASVPAALSSAQEASPEETPPFNPRRSSRKTAVGQAAAAAVTPDAEVTDIDSAAATPIADKKTREKKKKNSSKRKSSVTDSGKNRSSTTAKDSAAADIPAPESDSSAAASEKKGPSKKSPVGVKRRSSRKSSTLAAASAATPDATAIPQSAVKKVKNISTPQKSTKKSTKKSTRATPQSSAKKASAGTPASTKKKNKSGANASDDADASGSLRRSKRNSSAAVPASSTATPSKSAPTGINTVEGGITFTEPLQLADGVDGITTPTKETATENLTPMKRVLVDKDVEVPHGKRLKRTVRTVTREVPVPEAVMAQHKLDVSKWKNGRIYKEVDSNLSRIERVTEISRQILFSHHYQHTTSCTDEDSKRIFATLCEAMKTAPKEPAPRKNPENALLKKRVEELEEKLAQQKRELRQWEHAEKMCAEMEKNPVTLPTIPANDNKITKSMSKKGVNEARKALESALLQCAMVDVKLTKLDRIASDADMKVKGAVDVFNEYVKRTSKLAKTPKKPSAFPRGGEVVAETPRGATGAGSF